MNSISEPILTAEEILAWVDRTTDSWLLLVEKHPEVLLLPCDIADGKTVADLLQHVIGTEVRYAQLLMGALDSGVGTISQKSAADIFAAHDIALLVIGAVIDRGGDWERLIDFQTLTRGRVRASRKTVFIHMMMHSIRHFAQLATLVRQHGFNASFPMDYLAMASDSVSDDKVLAEKA